MANNPKKDKIPTWLIILGFCIGFWPGGILLAIRVIQEANIRDNGAYRRTDREWNRNAEDVARQTQATVADLREQSRTYDGQGRRTYQPARASGERPVQGGQNPDGTYHYSYTYQSSAAGRPAERPAERPQAARSQFWQAGRPAVSLLDESRLSPKVGKGLRLAGNIVLGCGAFLAALVFLGCVANGEWFFDTVMASSITALCCCTPGAVLSLIGNRKHNRVMRCRTYAVLIGQNRSVEIERLAAAIPTSYSKCCDDLNWMLGEGMLKGMYIDGASRKLTYPDAAKAAERRQSAPEPGEQRAQTTPQGDKIYPQEARIRDLNDQIRDEYVSQRMDRLEELTHKILAYAEAHPEKEGQLRQFHNHYLPKTLSILESYARMERMGVEGGNISSAMKDVEDIMDKLVLGFEKQLDALFDSEAMDVTTDISVLENMMNMEGLSDLDPFGTLKKDDALLK